MHSHGRFFSLCCLMVAHVRGFCVPKAALVEVKRCQTRRSIVAPGFTPTALATLSTLRSTGFFMATSDGDNKNDSDNDTMVALKEKDSPAPVASSETGETPSVKETLQKFWETFSGSQIYRTLLLTGAFLTSPKIRSMVSPPILLSFFLVIWAWYTYDARFNELADLVGPRRQKALQSLRKAQSELLSGSSSSSKATSSSSSSASMTEQVEARKLDYEKALRKELEVRVILPGIWSIEMDPSQEDFSAAIQFLGLEITDEYKLIPTDRKR